LLFGVLIALATVGVAMACYQRFVNPAWGMLGDPRMAQFLGRPSGPFAVPNSFAGFLILLFPAVTLPLWKRGSTAVERVLAGYLAGVLLLGLGLTVSRGAWLGLLVALALWPWMAVRRRLSKRVAVSTVVAVLGLVALGSVYANVPRARERLDVLWRDRGEVSRPGMWRAAWLTFRENPWWGSGAGSYAAMFEKYRPENEQKHPQWTHNDYLNTLSDYGVAGFALFFGACGVVVWGGIRNRRAPQSLESKPRESWVDSADFSMAAAVGLVAFGLHLVVDFHLKIPALAMSAATIAGLALGRMEWPCALANAFSGEYWMRKTGRFFALAFASSVVLVSALWVVPRYHAESIRRVARLRIDGLAGGKSTAAERGVVLRAVVADLTRALAIDAANPQTWADRAYAASALGHDESAQGKAHGLAVESDARRALALTDAVAEYWIRLGVGLDMQGRWGEAGDAFSEALRRAPTSATTWFYQAYHFSLNPVTRPLARSAIATSLRLDPYHPEADSLRRNLAERR
jgi:O-antigen ligase